MLFFKGTDTFAGIEALYAFYGATEMPGHSIPAAEHSTITSWGRDHELDAYRNMLQKYPTGPVAVVSDSFNILEACSNMWGGVLKEEVINRKGVLIVRPDSGEPEQMVPEVIGRLADKFGSLANTKGYHVLHPKVRVIQGDGISDESLGGILNAVMDAGYSADNIAFGSGGGLLQMVNRDTQRFAFKCSSITINGDDRDVFKSPKSDPKKNSKRGKLKLVKFGTGYVTVNETDPGEDILIDVFDNGHLLVDHKFEDVRARANN
jgi:nicotinamide phosphoribosyltransferase